MLKIVVPAGRAVEVCNLCRVLPWSKPELGERLATGAGSFRGVGSEGHGVGPGIESSSEGTECYVDDCEGVEVAMEGECVVVVAVRACKCQYVYCCYYASGFMCQSISLYGCLHKVQMHISIEVWPVYVHERIDIHA